MKKKKNYNNALMIFHKTASNSKIKTAIELNRTNDILDGNA